MPNTISLKAIRQRKNSPDEQEGNQKAGSPLSSPFSYVILLDENDRSTASSPATNKASRNHTGD
jgi:hypothetical protein